MNPKDRITSSGRIRSLVAVGTGVATLALLFIGLVAFVATKTPDGRTWRVKYQIDRAGLNALPRSAHWVRPRYLQWMKPHWQVNPICGLETNPTTPPRPERLDKVDLNMIGNVRFRKPWGDTEFLRLRPRKAPAICSILLQGPDYTDQSLRHVCDLVTSNRNFNICLKDTTSITPEGLQQLMETGRVSSIYIEGSSQLGPAIASVFEHLADRPWNLYYPRIRHKNVCLIDTPITREALLPAIGKSYHRIDLHDCEVDPSWVEGIHCDAIYIDRKGGYKYMP